MAIKWRRVWVSDEAYESAAVFDVNGDGIPDIVSGAFWYEGPDFRKKHEIGEVKKYGEYYDDFSTIALDINGNGTLDFVTGGWWGNNLRWRENPGQTGKPWPEHIIADTGHVETTRAWDLDGDGISEILPNCPSSNEVVAFKLVTDRFGKGTGRFEKKLLYSFGPGITEGHGLGAGDIAGNGRMDIALQRGWLEAPKDTWNDAWLFHSWPELGKASIPILIEDINGDGKSELIVGSAHGYGLDYYTKIDTSEVSSASGIVWQKHAIDPFNAQYHDLQWVDIDGDGQKELVTGKRHRAHCGNEAGEWDDLGIYYFKWTGEAFSKQVVSFAPIGQGGKGLGIHFAVADLNNDGKPEIIAPGKEGLCVFFNEGDPQLQKQ